MLVVVFLSHTRLVWVGSVRVDPRSRHPPSPGWMNGWMDRWMNGWEGETGVCHIYVYVHIYTYIHTYIHTCTPWRTSVAASAIPTTGFTTRPRTPCMYWCMYAYMFVDSMVVRWMDGWPDGYLLCIHPNTYLPHAFDQSFQSASFSSLDRGTNHLVCVFRSKHRYTDAYIHTHIHK